MPTEPALFCPPHPATAGPTAAPRPRRPWSSWWTLCAAWLLVLWGGLALSVDAMHRSATQERAALAQASAQGHAGSLGLQLAMVDRTLLALREQGRAGIRLPAHAALQQGLGPVGPMLLEVLVADAAGTVVASSLASRADGSLADHTGFRASAREPADRLHVGAAEAEPATGRLAWHLVRPVLGPGGSFRGAVVAVVDPLLHGDLAGARDALAGDEVVVVIGQEDGMVRARLAAGRVSWGQSVARWPMWDRLRLLPSGRFEMPGVDGVRRLFGFQQVQGVPLTVGVGRPVQPWWQLGRKLRAGVALALALTLLSVWKTHQLVRRDRERSRSYRRLQDARMRQAEVSRMKSGFLASVAHELRTPLNAVLGFSELVRDTAPDADTRRYGDFLLRNGQHLHALVNTLLDLARIDAGRMEVGRERVDIGLLVRTLVDVHRLGADAKGLAMELALDLPEGMGLEAHTDRAKLTRVLDHVLQNAVKFTERGSVRIAGALEGDTLRLQVVDTGPGIPPGRLSRVFDHFSSDGAREHEGSGLGLALSRQLLQLLGGSIEVRSPPGQGTEVSLCLPQVRQVGPA